MDVGNFAKVLTYYEHVRRLSVAFILLEQKVGS